MLLHQALALGLAAWPAIVSAAIFPSDTKVKMLDSNGFKKAMKSNMTSVVAFVAPWCGHCQRMAPEYSKAAEALQPMVPLYAVDCDQDSNKRLCSEQGVQGFPTVKLFPRGSQSKPVSYDSGQRTAESFFYWASRNIPHGVKRLDKVADVTAWANEHVAKPCAVLLNSGKEIPLMWKTLGNKYKDHITFSILQDKSGKSAVKLGVEEKPDRTSKVLVYPAGSSDFVRFDGRLKFNSLDKYLKSVADGTAEFPAMKGANQQFEPPSTGEGEQESPAQTQAHAVQEAEPTIAPPEMNTGAEPSVTTDEKDVPSAASEGLGPEAAVGEPEEALPSAPAETLVQSEDVHTHAKDEL